MGRPSSFTPEIAEEICARLEQGIDLEQICRDEKMPARRTVHDWANGETKSIPAEFSAVIARARTIGHDTIASNCRRTAKGDEGFSSGDVQRDKLIIETDLKLLAKWSPKKYGDRIDHEHTGNIAVTITQADADL